jgi:predicted LPLAT superfamily acyltransferase
VWGLLQAWASRLRVVRSKHDEHNDASQQLLKSARGAFVAGAHLGVIKQQRRMEHEDGFLKVRGRGSLTPRGGGGGGA